MEEKKKNDFEPWALSIGRTVSTRRCLLELQMLVSNRERRSLQHRRHIRAALHIKRNKDICLLKN